MKNRALYMNGKLNLSFKELDIPKPQPGEVLLKVGYCGVCGSDVHLHQVWECRLQELLHRKLLLQMRLLEKWKKKHTLLPRSSEHFTPHLHRKLKLS